MERDLAAIRLKRAERDKAQGALRQRDLNRGQEGMEGDQAEKKSPRDLRSSDEPTGMNEHDDVIMVDAKDEPTTTKAPSVDQQKTLGTVNGSAAEHLNKVTPEVSAQLIHSKRPAFTNDSSSERKEPTSVKVAVKGHGDPGSLMDQPIETPTTSNLRDVDFETMFNDTEAIGGSERLDFGVEFSAGPQGTNFENGKVENEELSNLNATSNEDINTLLPGLENYVNASDDFSVINLANGPTLANNTGGKVSVTLAPQASEPAPAESTFDDLFSSANFMDDSADYGMDQSDNINDLGDFDDWFKTSAT
jgi:hypothetical protein